MELLDQMWYLMSIIPAMQEVEIGGLPAQAKKFSEILSQKSSWVLWYTF
jgi:hypothetical protein